MTSIPDSKEPGIFKLFTILHLLQSWIRKTRMVYNVYKVANLEVIKEIYTYDYLKN